jgi:hypothetical protein
MPAESAATDFSQVRPWRNRSPGDLRPLPLPEKWFGQGGVDDGPGGPFAIFVTPADGWRALAMCLLTYQDVHHLRTVRQIIGRYAPSLENDTGGYISLVCKQIGVGPDDRIDVHQPATMTALVSAIALAEGGHLPWDERPRDTGVMLALYMQVNEPPASLNPQPAVSTVVASDPDNSADVLMAREQAEMQG